MMVGFVILRGLGVQKFVAVKHALPLGYAVFSDEKKRLTQPTNFCYYNTVQFRQSA
jgi:hypothetical protein